MKVATIQFAPKFLDLEWNVDRMKELVLEAATEGADLIVMPELCTSGYSMMSVDEARPMAECVYNLAGDDKPSGSLPTMWNLVKELNVTLVYGFIEEDHQTGQLYNAQVIMDPGLYHLDNGEVVEPPSFQTYRKINRWGQDWLWAQSGTQNPPVQYSARLGKRIGLLICRDIRDKKDSEWTNFYSPGDCDIVCFSSNFGRGAFPATSWMDFTIESKVHLVVSNRYGKEENNDFGHGGVCVVSPDGTVQCEGLRWNKDCIVYVDIA